MVTELRTMKKNKKAEDKVQEKVQTEKKDGGFVRDRSMDFEKCEDGCKCGDKEKMKECNCGDCECEEDGDKEELKNQVKRALADYHNLEKRVAGQRQEWARSSNRDLIVRLLPVLDTLMLASKHVDDEGLKLSIQQFLQTLKQEGAEQIKTVGEKFDPHTMEGVGTAEGEEGKVVREVRPGFRLYDKVIRPAQVIVGGKSSN